MTQRRIRSIIVPLTGFILVLFYVGSANSAAPDKALAAEVPQVSPVPQQQGPPWGRGGRGRGMGRGMGRGQDARFVEDHNVFFFLLDHRDAIRRTVTDLPNGIETVTESDQADVATKIQEHVAAMYERVENVNPIHMRDPLFREIFAHAEKISMEMTETDKGVRVKETSDDPYVARLLQAHARVVSLFIKNGRPELHRNHELPPRDASAQANTAADTSCVNCQLDRFAEFDRVYIPALALTKQQQMVPARQSLNRLQEQWEQQRPMLQECRAEWAPELDKVTAAIQRAEQRLREGQSSSAHEELEAIREIFMLLRQQHGMDYELDTLNEFHTIMEQIVMPAMAMKPSDLNDEVLDRFETLSEQAASAWQQVTTTSFGKTRFHLDETRQAKLQELIDAQTQRVAALQTALGSGEPERVLVAARALKPGFAKVFMFFGEPLPSSN